MSSPNWALILGGPARKSLRRVPAADRERILAALAELAADPHRGDVRPLQPTRHLPAFRKRVGAYRILFELDLPRHLITITDINRRTSTTYRR